MSSNFVSLMRSETSKKETYCYLSEVNYLFFVRFLKRWMSAPDRRWWCYLQGKHGCRLIFLKLCWGFWISLLSLIFRMKSLICNGRIDRYWSSLDYLKFNSFPCQNSGKLGVSMPSCSFLALLFFIINFRAGLVLLVCISSWIVYVVSCRKLLSWSIA